MSESSIQPIDPSNLAAETQVFLNYLEQFDLPTDNIIANTEERSIVASNLPIFISTLSTDIKKDARYLSKFIGATAIGLFDAALNYVWNEVVLSLRKKASVYGVELFFDAAVGGKNREAYKDESDLEGLKDKVLLDTCRKLELISDIVYRKLENILTMRNEVAASHPNVESIGGFELLGWLQTCVKDVLQDQPSESAIKIRALVYNLKSSQEIIDPTTLERIKAELKFLSIAHVNNLLITIFGIFVSPDSGQVLRKNISEIAPSVWEYSSDQVKYKIGSQIDGFRTNFYQDKLQRGIEFLRLVGGLNFEGLSSRIIALTDLASQLEETHEGRDNYYHEPPIMREILQYCNSSNDIPKEILPTLVKVILRCRIGRGVTYKDGVSPSGLPLYDSFFTLLDDEGIAQCIISLFQPEINSKLQNPICKKHLRNVLLNLRLIVISERVAEALEFLLKDIEDAYLAGMKKEFRELTSSFIAWT